MKPSILLSTAALLLIAMGAHADSIYYSIDSTTKGLKFAPETSRFAGKYEALDFDYTVKSPRDVSTGQASGKRQHGAITLTRMVGESSPQLFATLTSNDMIKTLTIDFTRTDTRGQEVLAYSIRLTNVQISEIKQFIATPGDFEGAKHASAVRAETLYENVSLVFQRIDISSPASKTSAMDEWR